MENGSPRTTSSSHPRAAVSKEKITRLWVLYGFLVTLLLALVILLGIFLFKPIRLEVSLRPNIGWSQTSRIRRSNPSRKKENCNETSYSQGYLRATFRLQSMMNLSVDPCEDFYEYACGKGISEMEIPSRGRSDPLQRVSDEIDKQMDKLLRSSQPSSSKAIEKLKAFYQTCLNDKNNGHLAIQTALQKIKLIGEFPLLGGRTATAQDFNWAEYILSLAKIGREPAIFELKIGDEFKNNSNKVLNVDGINGPPFGTREMWLNDTVYGKTIEAYRKWTKNILTMFAKDANLPPNPQLDEELEDLFIFYRRLANMSHTMAEYRSLQSNAEKFSSLVRRVERKTGLNLRELLRILAPDSVQGFLSNENLEANVFFDLVLDDLTTLVHETSPNTWKNYYQSSILRSYLQHFPEKYADVTEEFNQVLVGISGTKEKTPKWKKCLESAMKLNDAYSAVYVRKYSGQEIKKEVMEMVEKLRASFSQIVQEADWLDAGTKRNAFVKLGEMLVKIGYHENVLDDVKLDEQYKEFNIDERKPFLNMMQECKRWSSAKGWQDALNPVNRNKFEMDAPEVNALHELTKNAITFPLGILQEPFFDIEGPKAINYGAIGGIIGHEITHGFDNIGRKFDEIGNLRDWWTNSSAKNYEERAKDMVEQYSNFEVKEVGMRIDGKRSLGENIADNGGVKEAFRAYKAYLEKNGREKQLPGLAYTSEQLFFIGWSHNWCSKETLESVRNRIMTSNYAVLKARVNIPVSNQPEFAEAFNCPTGSPMNPVKKATVW